MPRYKTTCTQTHLYFYVTGNIDYRKLNVKQLFENMGTFNPGDFLLNLRPFCCICHFLNDSRTLCATCQYR